MKVFRKTGVSTLINILGMSVAFAAAMILMAQVKWDATYDKNFEGHEQVFRIEHDFTAAGLYMPYLCRPIIEGLKTDYSNIEAVGTMKAHVSDPFFHREGDKESMIKIPSIQVDSSMFRVFPFTWVEGSASEFAAPNAAVLSESYASLLFGDESAVGKNLQTAGGTTLRIVGVFKDRPRNHSMHYGLFANLGEECLTDPGEWSYSSYIKLKDPSQAKETETALFDVLREYVGGNELNEEDVNIFRRKFRLSQLHDAHFERDLRSEEATANKAVSLTLAAIAILLILVAIINFINFAFAEIPFRIKNINTRKVLGESRGSLIGRQLVHAGLIAFIAFVIACVIVQVVSGTSLASYVSDSIALKDNFNILALMMGVALISAVASGFAPALYSTAQPAALVLKGSYATSVKGKALRNFMVSLQFFLSFILIIVALFVGVQTRFMLNRDMGFSRENILQVACGPFAGRQHEALEAKLLQNPAVKEVTFAANSIVNDIFMSWMGTGNDSGGQQVEMDVLPVADDFVEFFGLQILEGRDFLQSDNQSESGTFIANETFMQGYPAYQIGSRAPGAGDEEYSIIGVVKDFHFRSLQHAMRPLMLFNEGKNQTNVFTVMFVKTVPGADFKALSESIKEAVCSFSPMVVHSQVDVRFLDEWIQNMYDKEQSLGKLITIASFVALLIALIGIIGLVFFETQFLRKEIAVRRVNGGTVGDILKMINKKYLIMAGVSFVIATPVAYWLMTAWREGFAYQSPVPVWIFIVALLAVTAITLAVVTLQSWRTANANPVESLKNE